MPPFSLCCGCHAILELFRHLRRHAQEHLTGKDVEIPADPSPPYDALPINEEERPFGNPSDHMGVLVLPFGRAV